MASSHRRSSDPFRDNASNTVFNHDRNGPRSSPLPPPKDDMLSAVRDSVTVKPVTDPARSKTGASQSSTNSGTVTPPRPRRSERTDTHRPRTKKASKHADIIDRLDYSGVGAAMLHHDGPFDACAPSRNKHKHKAPMMAWGPGDNSNESLEVSDISVDRRLSPLAQSILPPMSSYDSPYGAASLYPTSPSSPGSIPKKRVDALAEAWGMAEPEPFEEFFAGGGDRSAGNSIKNGKDGHNNSSSRRAKDARDAHRDHLEDASRTSRPHRTRSTLPPPKPISLPGSRSAETESTPEISSSPNSPDLNFSSGDNPPRRSRSFISRIRKMRDSPNVPITYQEEIEPSESTGESPTESFESGTAPSAPSAPVRPSHRPTHKHQTSFLGRLTRSSGGANGGGIATIPPVSDSERPADFVYMDDETREKDLPAPPSDYFGDAGRGLGRKTSLMKRFKGVRRSTKP